MTPDPHDPTAQHGGIHDTGDLARIWDALEALARRIDERTGGDPSPAADVGDEPSDEQTSDGAAHGPGR